MNPTTTTNRPTTIPDATTQPPAIGQRWEEARGIYAGGVAYPDGRVVGLVWADDLPDLQQQPWGKYGQDVAGARCVCNGHANTHAMATAGCSIAQQVLAADPYAWIPSQIEAIQLAAMLRHTYHSNYGLFWTSTQDSGDDAFVQSFETGSSYWYYKDNGHRVRAVRGFVLQHLSASDLGDAPAEPSEKTQADTKTQGWPA